MFILDVRRTKQDFLNKKGKSFAFRWFVDVEPQNDSVLLKIQKSRRETQTVEIGLDQDLDKTQELIREAYNSIH